MTKSVSYIYLATPYSSPNRDIEERRYELCLQALAVIAPFKIPVYSPIAHWHPVARRHHLPGDAAFWTIQDHAMVFHSKELWVYELPGHDTSLGVAKEIEFAQSLNITVRHIPPTTESLIDTCKYYKGH